jgi:CHAD domain-containing protein
MSRDETATTDPLSAYLREQATAVLARGDALPGPDAVHRTRVAIRRLRSTLQVFAPLLDLSEDERGAADEELRWFAGLLGEARDRHVQRTRFAEALAALPPELVLGPVAARIDGTLGTEQAAAEQAVDEALGSERCRALSALLVGWRLHPPVADADPHRLRKRAEKASAKAARRLAAACEDGDDEHLHRARKAAKRARYAAELTKPLGHGKKQRKHAKSVQALLGDHQDAVVAATTLRRLVSGVPAGESGFTFGLLHARERAEADRLRDEVCALVGR